VNVDDEARGAVALGKRLESGEAEGRLDNSAAVRGPVVVAQGADELVDLDERLARHLLDRLEGFLRTLGISFAEQPRGAGLDEDDVDRMARGVV
jgi:hypothetical protein